MENNRKPQKIEGDGRAPAGIFKLGTTFGYDEKAPPGCKLPYRHITDRDYYIDHPESQDYNRWVRLPEHRINHPAKFWDSFERMKRGDGLYELGIVIEHNTDSPVKRRGSAIFFHVWRQPGVATAGCTAMAKENLMALIRWLDPASNPLFIQIAHLKEEAEHLRVKEMRCNSKTKSQSLQAEGAV